uniref:Uncharacterized protein n=1 Tax=Megaselia scalaris TaxID=36166 RepID=T1GPG2_MEGSC
MMRMICNLSRSHMMDLTTILLPVDTVLAVTLQLVAALASSILDGLPISSTSKGSCLLFMGGHIADTVRGCI